MAKEVQPIIIKKKKHGGHGHHGGAWKLAYADLVTAMMAFFLVMWIIGLDPQTKVGIAAYFNDPGAAVKSFASSRNVMQMDGRPPPPPEKVEENDLTTKYLDLKWAKVLNSLVQDKIKNDGPFKGRQHNVVSTITDKGLQIELSEDSRGVFFARANNELTDVGKSMVKSLTAALLTSRRPVRITGYTDTTPGASGGMAKMDIGFARARAVDQAMVASGYPAELCRQISSRGDTQAAKGNGSSLDNNRVVILVPFEPE